MRIAACLALLAGVALAQDVPPDLELAAAVLRHAERVSTASAAPTLEAELVAVRELHAAGARATPVLRALAQEASHAGRILALCALEVREDPACDALRAGLAGVDAQVAVAWRADRPPTLLALREVLASSAADAVRRAPGAPPAEWGFTRGTPDLQGGGLPWGAVLEPPGSDASALEQLSLEAWVARLGQPNRLIREEAERALEQLGPRAIDPLRAALARPNLTRWAARALARLGFLAVPAIPELCAGLEAPDPLARLACARTLGELGPYAARARAALVARVDQEHELLRVRVACAARVLELPAWTPGAESPATEVLLELYERALDHPDPELRALGGGLTAPPLPPGPAALGPARRLLALGELGAEELALQGVAPDARLDLLLEGLTSSSSVARLTALEALSATPEVEAALAPRFEDEALRPQALAALAALALELEDAPTAPVVAGLADPELAGGLSYGLDLVQSLPAELQVALVELACSAHPAAELAWSRFMDAGDLRPGHARLRARLEEPNPERARALALRSRHVELRALAEATLREALRDPDPEVRRQAAALLIEGEVQGETATLAWGELAQGSAAGDRQVLETLELWAREPGLSPPSPEQALAWLEGKDLPLAAWAAGAWFRVAEDAGDRARQAALSALLRLISRPGSAAARVLARRAFSEVPAEVSTILDEAFGPELAGVIFRGLLATVAADPDGAWAAETLQDLLLDVDLGDPDLPEAWCALFAAALPRAQPRARWRLVYALTQLGTRGAPAAPALRRARVAAQDDPELELAIQEALRVVLGA